MLFSQISCFVWRAGSSDSVVSTLQPEWLMFDSQQGQGVSVLKGFDDLYVILHLDNMVSGVC